MMKEKVRGFFPVLLLFVVLNGFFLSGKNIFNRWNADQEALIIGNLVLFFVTLVSFMVLYRGMKNSNPNVFVRSVFGSFMIKFFICAIAAFIYISQNKKNINKPALFICMGLFLLYLFTEVGIFMKLLKKEKNG
jgi:hypothetical protein